MLLRFQIGLYCLFSLLAFFPNSSRAETFICKDARGKSTIQDFPCGGQRPQFQPPQKATTPPKTSANSEADDAFNRIGFQGRAGYERASEACFGLMDQYDALAPMSKCDYSNQACLSRAMQESRQISQQLWNRPEWKSNQCDKILKIEAATANGTSDVIQKTVNDEIFIINDKKFKAKTYCFNQSVGDRVVFTDGSRYGSCVSAKFVNKRNDLVCDVWCE